jgi:rhodanese-related sulfurtransferase
LQGAVFLPLSKLKNAAFDPELRDKLAELSKDKVLYCHCKAGGRVLTAAPILKSLGYDARPLKAGYDDLLEAGFEKDKTAEPE